MIRRNDHKYYVMDGMPVVVTLTKSWVFARTTQSWQDAKGDIWDATVSPDGMSPVLFNEMFGSLPELPESTNAASVRDTAKSKSTENEGAGFLFQGNSISEQWKASALKDLAMALRPDEPPLGSLSLVEQNWIATAITYLIQIDEYRNGEIINKSAHCIFEIGCVYFQCLAPNYAKHLICEAVSAKSVPEIGTILTPKKKIRLVREFGFAAPGHSPNFSRKLEIKSKDDLAFAARMAFRVLRDIYDVKDFGIAKFKLWPPKPVALSIPESTEPSTRNFILTIDKQPLILKLEAILSLFGKSRTIEFAEGKWTPYVSFQLEEPANAVPAVQHIDFTDMSESEIIDALKSLPPDVADFAGFVRDEIEKIEKAQSVKK